MSTAPILDLQSEAPRAIELATLASRTWHTTPATASRVTERSVARALARPLRTTEKLPGLSSVLQWWKPLYEREPRFEPGLAFVEFTRSQWPKWSHEIEACDRAFAVANKLPMQRLLADESRNLRGELRRTPVEDVDVREFYEILLSAITDLKRVARKPGVAAIMTHPASRDLATWTLRNLEGYLRDHWALVRANKDLRDFLAERRRSFREMAGSLHGPAGQQSPSERDLQ